MATTTVTLTAQYNVSLEQISKCDRIVAISRNKVFYQVESSQGDQVYHVEFSDAHHVLTCTCKAAQEGLPNCWHRRAALAAEQLFKQELRRQRQQEQQELEREEAYRFEQMLRELEESEAELAAYLAAVDKRDQERKARADADRRQHGALNGNRGFSLLK